MTRRRQAPRHTHPHDVFGTASHDAGNDVGKSPEKRKKNIIIRVDGLMTTTHSALQSLYASTPGFYE